MLPLASAVNEYDALVGICMGIGLAAASGFRVFLPPFLLSIFVRSESVELDVSGTAFEYFDSDIAVVLLGAATIVEALAYYVPWVDNLLDSITSPAAVIAGSGMTAILLEGNVDPVLQWSLAIIAGGGVSGVVQSATVVTRGASTMGTGGLGNPIVSTVENIASLIIALIAVMLPFVAVFVVIILIVKILSKALSSKENTPHQHG